MGYLAKILTHEGRIPDAILIAGRGRCLRAASQAAPGRLRASCPPVLRPVRGVLPLDWDRRKAGNAAAGHVPGNLARSRVRIKPGESRGGAPRGERARSRWFCVSGSSVARFRARGAGGWQHPFCVARTPYPCVCRRSASPHYFGGERSLSCCAHASYGAIALRERAHASAPAIAGEGDHWSSRSERTVVEGARAVTSCCR
jgi:hypothetical protein